MVIDGEFAATLRAMQRQGNTLSAVIRTTWDGQDIEPLTKNARIRVTEPHIGLVAHITARELTELLKKSDISNGFANRFLWGSVWRPKKTPFPEAMPEEDVTRIAKVLVSAIKAAHRPGELTMTVAAKEEFARRYLGHLTVDYGDVAGEATARAEAQVVRLVLLTHSWISRPRSSLFI
jgi:hypothetical protein